MVLNFRARDCSENPVKPALSWFCVSIRDTLQAAELQRKARPCLGLEGGLKPLFFIYNEAGARPTSFFLAFLIDGFPDLNLRAWAAILPERFHGRFALVAEEAD
jgi:hypothetical protein